MKLIPVERKSTFWWLSYCCMLVSIMGVIIISLVLSTWFDESFIQLSNIGFMFTIFTGYGVSKSDELVWVKTNILHASRELKRKYTILVKFKH